MGHARGENIDVLGVTHKAIMVASPKTGESELQVVSCQPLHAGVAWLSVTFSFSQKPVIVLLVHAAQNSYNAMQS